MVSTVPTAVGEIFFMVLASNEMRWMGSCCSVEMKLNPYAIIYGADHIHGPGDCQAG